MNWLAKAPRSGVCGEIRVPGDKSISQRAVLLAALADGQVQIDGFLTGSDPIATLNAIRALGVRASMPAPEQVVMQGVGMHGLRASQQPLDLGNSGTGMRLLSGVLAGQPFASTLIGDRSLSARPMDRIKTPLEAMGARLLTTDRGTAPLRIEGRRPLRAMDYESPVASAQVKSCVLLAGLFADGAVSLREPLASRDHTERMLSAAGAPIEFGPGFAKLTPPDRLELEHIEVPGDPSSAAFALVAAALLPGSELQIDRLGMNPGRIGLLQSLASMGADVKLVVDDPTTAGEPIGQVIMRHSELQSITLKGAQIPPQIDEIPILAVAAAFAEGETSIRDAQELRVKESDRLDAIVAGLRAIGSQVELHGDGLTIAGGLQQAKSCTIDARDDHRIAMAFAIAGQKSTAGIRIENCAGVLTSYPNFVAQMQSIGLDLETVA